MMQVDIDDLLSGDLLSVPDDFSNRVMREVYAQPLPILESKRSKQLQWLALVAAAGVGLSQVLAFIFGMWAASSAL
ncbi:MAG: hypothetical protein ACM3VZ_01735 [Acidobacteriota bacterium]